MDSGSSADWSRLDRALQKATETFRLAAVEEDFQMVGLLCREAFISLAQTIYDESRHQTVDGVVPSPTDAKRMLEAFFVAELPGAGNEASRRHARAAVFLADALVHRRTARHLDAALCLEATTSTANLACILTGRAKQERVLPAVVEPFRIPDLNDPILTTVMEHYKAQGEEPALRLSEERDVRLATGYRLAYILGVYDASSDVSICGPSQATAGQLVAIVLKHLAEHPQKLHGKASDLVLNALSSAFPCRK